MKSRPPVPLHVIILLTALAPSVLFADPSGQPAAAVEIHPDEENVPHAVLTMPGLGDTFHTIERSPALGGHGAPWLPLDAVRPDASGWLEWHDPEPLSNSMFYRVRLPEPSLASVEPAIAPAGIVTTLYLTGSCLLPADSVRIGGVVIDPLAMVFHSNSLIEVTGGPFLPGDATVEIVRGGVVLASHDVFFGDPGSDPFRTLQGPAPLPPGAPVSAPPVRAHVTVLKSHGGGLDEDCNGVAAIVSGRQFKHTTCPSLLVAPTGELLVSQVDVMIPGIGLDFIWQRSYRSRTVGDSPMGWGWTHSYDIRCEVDTDAGLAHVHDGTGRRDTLKLTACVGDVCHFAAAGLFREGLLDAQVFRLTFADGGFWEFRPLDAASAPGRIARSVCRNGNEMTFQYDASGRLHTITDTLGSVHTLGYDIHGRIATLTDVFGRVWSYAYVESEDEEDGHPGDLKQVTTPAVTGTPHGNDFPDGKTTSYRYFEGNEFPGLHHNLVEILDGKGQTVAHIDYANSTNPADFDFETVRTVLRGTQPFKFHRSPITPAPANRYATTLVTTNDFDGRVREETYDSRHRLLQRREFTGFADPGSETTPGSNRPSGPLRATDPVYFETRWTWNPQSLITAIDLPGGGRREFVHGCDLSSAASPRQAANLRVIRMIAPGGETLSTSIEHDPRFGTTEEVRSSVEFIDGRYILRGGAPVRTEGFAVGESVVAETMRYSFPRRVVDPRGYESRATYDLRGNRTSSSRQDRGPGGLLAATNFTYDALGRLLTCTRPEDGQGRRRIDACQYPVDPLPTRGLPSATVVDQGGLALRTRYEYDARGNLIRHIDARGHDQLFTYTVLDQSSTRQSQQSSFGSRTGTRFHYDAADNLVRVEMENRDAFDNIDPAKPYFTREYIYDEVNLLTGCQLDEPGIVHSYEYDAAGRVTRENSPAANNGSHTDARRDFQYDERGLLFREIRAPMTAAESSTRFDYSSDGRLTGITTGAGAPGGPRVTKYDYDGFGRVTGQTDPMGNELVRAPDRSGNPVRVRVFGETTDQPGSGANTRLGESTFGYDGLNRPVWRADSFFDAFTGTPLGDGDRLGEVVQAPNGQVTGSRDDLGRLTTFTYDSAGRCTRVTDPKNNRIDYEYDATGNVVRATETHRSDSGEPDRVHRMDYQYDPLGRRIQQTDNVGNTERFAYDSRGLVVTRTDARSNDTCYQYDGVGRVTAATDYQGPYTAVPPVVVRQVRFTYQGDRPHSFTDGNGQVTTWETDDLGRVVRTTLADGTHTDTEFDAFGDPFRITHANGTVIEQTHDALGRLIQRDITPGPGVAATTTVETFAYDGLSRLVSATNDTTETTFRYDSLGHRVAESSALPAAGLAPRETQRNHAAVGQLMELRHPSGSSLLYDYDVGGRVSGIQFRPHAFALPLPVATLAYSGDTLERVARSNGIDTIFEYSGALGIPNPPGDQGFAAPRAITHVPLAPAPPIVDLTYSYDPAQNLSQRALGGTLPGGAVLGHALGYDALGRLVQSTRDNGGGLPPLPTIYQFDAEGNRLSVARDGGPPTPYLLDATQPAPADRQVNQYTVTPENERQYDANGHLVQTTSGGTVVPETRHYDYDYAGRVVAVRGDTGPLATYTYDALGRRVLKQSDFAGLPPAPASATRFLYDGHQVIEERDGLTDAHTRGFILDGTRSQDDGVISNFTWTQVRGPFGFVTSSGEIVHALTDPQGSTHALVAQDGGVLERYGYDDCGRPTFLDAEGNPITDVGGRPATASAHGHTHLYHGHEWEPESALYHTDAGAYDPVIGGFLSRIDPTNPHSRPYAGNNPWRISRVWDDTDITHLTERLVVDSTEHGLTSRQGYTFISVRNIASAARYTFLSVANLGTGTGHRTSDVTGEIYLSEGREMLAGTDTEILPWGAGIFRVSGGGGGGTTWGSLSIFDNPDLTGVRVHTGGASEETAKKLGAEAFADGANVGFGGGPSLDTVAHEAAHVVQQRTGTERPPGPSNSPPPMNKGELIDAMAKDGKRSGAKLIVPVAINKGLPFATHKTRHETAMGSIRNMK